MKTILQTIQDKIATVSEINYVDENWGQLDYYSPNMPVKWPCCLIDLNDGFYSNIGQDATKKPKRRQNGKFALRLTLADVKLTNTSKLAPQSQKNNAWKIYGIMENLHEVLHGFNPGINCSALLRRGFQRVLRDDGVTEFQIIYEFEVQNV